jgi:transposase
VESAWSYCHRPAIKNDLKKHQENQSLEVQAVSWKAQNQLHLKYRKLHRGQVERNGHKYETYDENSV